MRRNDLAKKISVALGEEPADIVIKNGKVIDVFNGEIFEEDIAIANGYFVGLGSIYKGKKVIDAGGRYISPAFIDGHVHIESSMLTTDEFAKVLLQHGVTSVIADPHEIANVLGEVGIQYMLKSTEDVPFDFYFMLPSSVPASSFEHSGAILEAKDLTPFYSHPRVLGLAEVMNYPAVFNAEPDMLTKIEEAKQHGKKVDGHAAGLDATGINIYMTAGIQTDHESTTIEEAIERLRRGMNLMIREGTVARDLKQIIHVVNDLNSRRCLFVTDDKHLDDLLHEGSIDYNIRLAISLGFSPITCIQMATINAAECFGLADKGAIAPGYKADFILLDDLKTIKISEVYKDGKLVVKDGNIVSLSHFKGTNNTEALMKTVHYEKITPDMFNVSLNSTKANIIEIVPNSLITKHIVEKVNVTKDGQFLPSTQDDHLKLAVIERHHRTKQVGLGIVKGLGLRAGAIATTVAHDSHNLVIAGTNDDDMAYAANAIHDMQGGLIVVRDGRTLAALQLSIAGLMSTKPYEEVYKELNSIHNALIELGASKTFNPFLTLSFLTLTVIPELKLTDSGLFSVTDFKLISINN